MLYAEYESYHFLSIPLSAYVRKNPMTASQSSAEGEDEMPLCSPAAKCRDQIKARTSVTVIPNNQMENVSQNEECQTRFTVFIPTFLSGSYLLVITSAEAVWLWEMKRAAVKLCLNLPAPVCPRSGLLCPDVCVPPASVLLE